MGGLYRSFPEEEKTQKHTKHMPRSTSPQVYKTQKHIKHMHHSNFSKKKTQKHIKHMGGFLSLIYSISNTLFI